MDALAMDRALMRIAHQIIEKNESTENLCIVGIKRRGEQLGEVIAKNLEKLGAAVRTGSLDITLYRDDLSPLSDQPRLNASAVDFDVNGKTVVLVDDVIYTGRTARAAIDAILSFGRPAKIQLAVLVDILDEVIRHTQLLGCLIELIGIERCQTAYLALH